MRASQAPAGRLIVRPLAAGDDLDAAFDLRRRAFGPPAGAGSGESQGPAAGAHAIWRTANESVIRDGRHLGVFDGPRLIAAGLVHDMRQWWRGRAVPMAGVAGVAVAPEERGRGVGRTLMTALLDLIAARSYPLSALFPSTLPIYRSLGWEIAGTSHEAAIAAHALRPLAISSPEAPPEVDVRRAGPDDAARALAVLNRVHQDAGDCGPATRDEPSLRLALGNEGFYCYLAEDGLLMYTWRRGHDEIFVQLAVASSEATTRALWGIVASHCWIAGLVRARIGPADPVWWMTREPFADAVDHDTWMLRVLDPAAAIAGRGFPAGLSAGASLELTDEARPENSGRWRLEVSGGHGSLSRDSGHGPALVAGARGLAALYAGTPVATLRRAGLAGGDSGGDALLDAAFAGAPYMLDRF
ncbi:MAG TPA: GNAT family N-acetyltransferase [Streptosporangiaceae bacterium]|nr:GNAT family N-acetyltransferase [Streptosporangiaceae bacterium]